MANKMYTGVYQGQETQVLVPTWTAEVRLLFPVYPSGPVCSPLAHTVARFALPVVARRRRPPD